MKTGGIRIAAGVLLLTLLLVGGASLSLVECPVCLAVVRKAEERRIFFSSVGTPLQTGCFACGDRGRVSWLKRRSTELPDATLSLLVQNPTPLGPTSQVDSGAVTRTFMASLKDLVIRSGNKEAQTILQELEGGSYTGQACYLRKDGSVYVLCRMEPQGTFSHADRFSALFLFDLEGEVLDVARLRTDALLSGGVKFADPAKDPDAVAVFDLLGYGTDVQVLLRQGGKETGINLGVVKLLDERKFRIGLKVGKLTLLPEK